MSAAADPTPLDLLIVGAGFGGLCLLHKARAAGLNVQVIEAAPSVGGTWYHNRYPGARVDVQSLEYSFGFDDALQQEWHWNERYASQPELLRYANHVADRFDLRRSILLDTRLVQAHWDEGAQAWLAVAHTGQRWLARFMVMATGPLSTPNTPHFEGLSRFEGRVLHTADWPHEAPDFTGQRVGVIGTGSSAIQAIPVIAEQAGHLTVFQRTPNFSVPAANGPLDPAFVSAFKANYAEHRQNHRLGLGAGFGDLEVEPHPSGPVLETAAGKTDAEVRALLEKYWHIGGARFIGVVGDTLANHASNRIVADFVRDKIREVVKDPQTAEDLCPTSHPIGTKRICVDTGYYEAYNRANVKLVNIRRNPIERITATGVQLQDGTHHELDALVLATGFDAMTGALLRIDVRGKGGVKLADKWAAGPRSYLGLGIEGFPNLFTITGPGSPSVLSNMLVSIEQHVDWTLDCIEHMRRNGLSRIEPDAAAEDGWVAHVNEVANQTLFPEGGSWYLGANIPGKPRVFMPYAAGVGVYREICDRVAANGYEGFRLGA